MNHLTLEQLYTRQQESLKQIKIAEMRLSRFSAANNVSKETIIMEQHKLNRLNKHHSDLSFAIEKRLGNTKPISRNLL